MAIVQQALKARGMTDATQRKHMVDTLLMSTASIIYDSNGQPRVRVDEYMKRRLEIKLIHSIVSMN